MKLEKLGFYFIFLTPKPSVSLTLFLCGTFFISYIHTYIIGSNSNTSSSAVFQG
ncbi:hypothetical protein ES319_D04G203800v1 [Gossypium barbadense]|uniref:Uncharacterized protein n=2 Tax=Gossypium TaxID=3633 RepID=A0A5J5RXX8_GOSBA|nr:hypothetical protein ES319_D04G203800v1 [Gossypium barbadense]TYG74828.1 hypothetical protein ES288_D04G214500v1 [Gossypium darwinii]